MATSSSARREPVAAAEDEWSGQRRIQVSRAVHYPLLCSPPLRDARRGMRKDESGIPRVSDLLRVC